MGQFAHSYQPPAAAPAGQERPRPPNPNAVPPSSLLIDPPTLINLGFEWFIQGDDNRNASVTVTYRKQGESAWKDALPFVASARRARLHGVPSRRDQPRICSPAASSTWNQTPPTRLNSSSPTPTAFAARLAAQ